MSREEILERRHELIERYCEFIPHIHDIEGLSEHAFQEIINNALKSKQMAEEDEIRGFKSRIINPGEVVTSDIENNQ